MRPPETLLIVKPSSLGDVVHTLPALRVLRRHFPGAAISWLVNPEWKPLLEGNPDLDRILVFPRGEFRRLRGWAAFPRWATQLRGQRPDLALDFQGLLRSALLAKLAGARQIDGLSDAREGSRFFYRRTAEVGAVPHAVDRYLELAKLEGCDVSGPAEFPLPEGVAPAGFGVGDPFVLLHPFARGEGKSLSAPQVARLCELLRPHPVVLVGRGESPAGSPVGAADWMNRTSLGELLWLIRRARVVVSVDSGPMHLAAAAGAPLLAIHTWSDPARVGPYRADALVWKNGAIRPMAEWLGRPAAERVGGAPPDEAALEALAAAAHEALARSH